MSDHYDYGYCDYHDTYHNDVKQAHKMQEPRQPTSEELDEIFWEQDAEALQHRKEGQAASPGNGATSAVKRMLWDEKTTRSVLGEDGYAWFVERVEREIAKCPHSEKAPITCPSCSAKAETLIAFTKVYFNTVPPVYRPVTLSALQPYPPSAVPLERQAEIIAVLKANPDESYAFFGPAGTGKTVLATALYSEMLYGQYTRPHPRWKWFPVRRVSAKKMLDQHAGHDIRRNDSAPDVTADKIRAVTQTGDKYRLFLEDINGGDVTATSRAILFEVVNALYENEGQLVITSNLTPAEFKRQYGEDLFWRIAKHCTVVNLFDEAAKK